MFDILIDMVPHEEAPTHAKRTGTATQASRTYWNRHSSCTHCNPTFLCYCHATAKRATGPASVYCGLGPDYGPCQVDECRKHSQTFKPLETSCLAIKMGFNMKLLLASTLLCINFFVDHGLALPFDFIFEKGTGLVAGSFKGCPCFTPADASFSVNRTNIVGLI